MAYDAQRGVTVLYGGSGGVGQPDSDEAWEWNGRRWRLGGRGGPPGRSFQAMAYDSKRQRVLLFGGRGGGSELSAWDGRAWTILATDGPARRDHHAAAYDAARDRFIVFGGVGYDSAGTPSGLLRDLWEWDGTGWDRRASASDPARFGMPAFAYDMARRTVILHGGSGGAPGRNRGTWAWDGIAWTEVHADTDR